jgi:pseudouridine-5'-phosphate glycosidase
MTSPLVEASAPVRRALSAGAPVVALETSVLAQGLPHPRNLEALDRMAEAIRGRGAEPAWTWVSGGRIRVGGSRTDLEGLAGGGAAKVARRDLAAAVAGGGDGATTVSATLWIAADLGVEVAATGGIGGVHPGGADVSADLFELARTAGTLVCAGPKSILDPGATLERMEELGVAVVGYRTDRLPFFLAEASDIDLEHRLETPEAVAAVASARKVLGVASTLLVCNPIPPNAALDAAVVAAAVRRCSDRAAGAGITGKALTPFLLSCLAEETGGASLEANLALLESNAALAADVASALASRTVAGAGPAERG